jgi:hypothetical protein
MAKQSKRSVKQQRRKKDTDKWKWLNEKAQ